MSSRCNYTLFTGGKPVSKKKKTALSRFVRNVRKSSELVMSYAKGQSKVLLHSSLDQIQSRNTSLWVKCEHYDVTIHTKFALKAVLSCDVVKSAL